MDYSPSGGYSDPGADHHIWICQSRHIRDGREYKDAYDLYYHIRNYGAGVQDIDDALKPIRNELVLEKALEILREDFSEHNALGPKRVANFITGSNDDKIQADVAGFVLDFLGHCKKP